jgi:DNA-binding transcriptional ArsR family regulator
MMSVNKSSDPPGYELEARRVLSAPDELKALAHPLRGVILDLLLERAATITELAAAMGKPKSTIAHHVAVLSDAGMLRVVATRRVRAIEERLYGRTARLFAVGVVAPGDFDPLPWSHPLADAVRESDAAYRADTMWANLRHARIPRAAAAEFWSRVEALVDDFSRLPRASDEVFGFATALFPTDFPTLDPEPPHDRQADDDRQPLGDRPAGGDYLP